MSNKFKAGDSVVVATLADLEEECGANWAIEEGLELNKVYKISQVNYLEWVSLEGKEYNHPPSRFNLATEAPNVNTTPDGLLPFNYEEAIKDLSRVVTEFDEEAKIKSIKQIKYSDKLVIETLDDTVYLYNPDGTPECGNTRKIFLKQPETVVYVNVYKDMNIALGYEYKSIEETKKNKGEGLNTYPKSPSLQQN